MLLRIPHPRLGEITIAGVVPKMSRTPGKVVKAGSGVGEDTRAVLAQDLGMSDTDIDRLQQLGAVHCGKSPAPTPAQANPSATVD